MDRSFAILGLREDATKEQVKAAYERRLAGYKSSDYDDDPEYARSKIAELKEAYEKAYARAGNVASERSKPSFSQERKSSNREETKRDAERDAQREETIARARRKEEELQRKQRQEEKRKEYDQKKRAMEQEEDNRDAGRKEFKKPDFTALKENAQDLKERAAQRVKDARDDWNEQTGTKKETEKRVFSAPLPGAGRQKPNRGSQEMSTSAKSLLGIVLSLTIGLMPFIFTMCDGSDDIYYDDFYDSDYSSYYPDSVYSEADWDTIALGEEITNLIYNGDLVYDPEWEYKEEDLEELEKAADRFAKRYTDHETMQLLCADLYDRVSGFPATEDDELEYQIREVFDYYRFPSNIAMEGYISPYTEEPIVSLTEYLQFLNKYYNEHFKE